MSDLQVKIQILEASGLQRTDKSGCSDPFVLAKFRGFGKANRVQTSIIHNSSNPVWNQELVVYPKNNTDTLLLKVYDHDTLTKDNLLGSVEISLANFFQQGWQDHWVQLMRQRGSWKKAIGGHATWVSCSGQLHFKIWFGLSSNATGLAPSQMLPQAFTTNSGNFGKSGYTGSFDREVTQTITYTSGFQPTAAPFTSSDCFTGNATNYGYNTMGQNLTLSATSGFQPVQSVQQV